VSAYQTGRELAGSFGIAVTLRPSRSVASARGVIESELAAVAASGVEDAELCRVRNQRVAGFYFALERMGGFGGVADRLNAYNVFCGDPALIITDVERFRSVSADAVGAVARQYVAGRPRVEVAVLGRQNAATAVQLDRSVVPPSDAASRFRPPDVQDFTLPCGISLWVFPRRDLPTVSGSVVVVGGALLQAPNQAGLAQLTTAMLDEGTSSRTAAEIALEAESIGATISAGSGWDASFVSFKCLSENLTAVLDLTVDVLLHPTFPETELGRVRAQSLAALQAERDHAESRAYRALLKALYATGHPYEHPLSGTEASVAELTRSDLVAFHSRFVVAGRPTIVVAGDVDPHSLAAELGRRLTSWSGTTNGQPVQPRAERAGGPRLILIDRPGAMQAVIRAGHVGLARSDPGYEHMLLVNQILGGQFSSRLNTKLREERGFTYGVRSSFDCRRQPGPFLISAAVQTNRLAESLEDIRQELAALVGPRPPDQLELDDARRALIEGQACQFETPTALVNRFGTLAIHDLPADHEAGFAARLDAIDLDSLIAAANRELHPGSLTAVVVADAAQVLEDLKRIEWASVEIGDG
jgi:predicted Zn-dependent peptidase